MAFETELESFAQLLPGLQMEEGNFVLIHEASLEGIFGTYEDAIHAGYQKFQLDRFLVKEIRLFDEKHLITRMFAPF